MRRSAFIRGKTLQTRFRWRCAISAPSSAPIDLLQQRDLWQSPPSSVAPIPDLPALTPERGSSTVSGHSARRYKIQTPVTPGLFRVPVRKRASRSWRNQPVSEQSALLMAPIETVASTLIGRRYKKVKKSADSFAQLTLERRHEFRIAVKKLRYTTEVFKDLFDNQGVAEFVQLLKPLQDDLGYVNDVRVANELLTDLQISNAAIARAAGIVLGWHDRGLADPHRKLRKHVRRFREARPFW